jgi:hypothetical protein
LFCAGLGSCGQGMGHNLDLELLVGLQLFKVLGQFKLKRLD